MEVLLNQLKITVVTEGDEENVLSIRQPDEVYEGRDYLPDTFKRLINFPNSTGYAVSHAGKFIAFTLISIFDDGETYVVRALRVAKQYEGKGIIKWFLGKINETLKATTAVKYKVSTDNAEGVKTARRLKEGRCSIVVEREMVPFINHIEIKTIKAKLETFMSTNLVVLDTNALSTLLDSVCVTDRNYGRKLVVYFVPFRPIKSNASLIMQETTMVIGSNLENLDRLLVTLGSQFEALTGTMIFIDIYGHVSYDLQSHIMFHVKHALETSEGQDLTVVLCFDYDTTNEFVKGIMENCLFTIKEINLRGYLCVETKV